MKKCIQIIGLILLGVLIYGSHSISRQVVSDQVVAVKQKVVIDPGHGGSDPGKIGRNEVKEKEINLLIAEKVKDELEKRGIEVVMTRKEDRGLENSKVADMKARVKLINESQARFAVSIHQNSYEDERIKGAQVFYYQHSKEGERLATIMQESLLQLDQGNHRKAKGNETYYLLRRTQIPTIIVECGFLTNPEEAEFLMEEAYQDRLAKSISDGVESGLKEEN